MVAVDVNCVRNVLATAGRCDAALPERRTRQYNHYNYKKDPRHEQRNCIRRLRHSD